jgi:hypothetical protein
MSPEDIPAAAGSGLYIQDEIILYGVKINRTDQAKIPFMSNKLLLEVRKIGKTTPLTPTEVAMAVVYGYSYEGHCYRLEKPKLMIFEFGGETPPANGCGFSGPDYSMWRISSKDKLLELNTSVDLAEALILDANLPGNRTPNTYGNNMMLAHRSGRLSRSGGNSA